MGSHHLPSCVRSRTTDTDLSHVVTTLADLTYTSHHIVYRFPPYCQEKDKHAR